MKGSLIAAAGVLSLMVGVVSIYAEANGFLILGSIIVGTAAMFSGAVMGEE
jgi:hypothetical protein